MYHVVSIVRSANISRIVHVLLFNGQKERRIMKFADLKKLPEYGEFDDMELALHIPSRTGGVVKYVVTDDERIEVFEMRNGINELIMEFGFKNFYRLATFLYHVEQLFAYRTELSNTIEDILVKIQGSQRR